MTREECAERLGTTERHVRQLTQDRKIPHVKVGQLVRYDPDEIDAWLDDQRREPVG